MKKQKEKEPKEINLDFEIQMGSQIIAPPPVERGIDRNYTMINDLIGFPSPLRYPDSHPELHWGSNNSWDIQDDWDSLDDNLLEKRKKIHYILEISTLVWLMGGTYSILLLGFFFKCIRDIFFLFLILLIFLPSITLGVIRSQYIKKKLNLGIKPPKSKGKTIKTFEINEYIKLKLYKYTGTNIYIKNERFMQCKYLLFQLPNQEIKEYEKINSIDEAKKVYDSRGENPLFNNEVITIEEEFWGHCSNLQAWYENNYDTRLLHSNLSFPLLKKLTKVGDSLAKKMFKEEIIERLLAGYWPVAQYLIEEKYLDFFTREEQEILIKDIKKKYATHASHSYFIDTFIKKTKISDFSVKDIVSGEDISNDITITVNTPEEVGDIFIQDEGYFNIQEKFSIKKLFTKKI